MILRGPLLALGMAFLSGCAGTQAAKTQEPLRLMRSAMDQHLRGEWAESNQSLEDCLALLQSRPAVKLGEHAGALLLSPDLKKSAGDPAEHVFLHTLGMVNYAMLGQVSEALVEARRSDSVQRQLVDLGRSEGDDPLARVLSAKLYEDQGFLDDARIDLERARAAYAAGASPIPEPSFVGQDLERLRKGGAKKALRGRLGEVWVLVYSGKLRVDGGKVEASEKLTQGRVSSGAAHQAPLEEVQDLTPLMQDALHARALGDGVRSLGRVVVRSAFIAALAILTRGESLRMDGSGEFIASAAKRDDSHWVNLPAQVHATRLLLPAGSQPLWVQATVGGMPRQLSATVRVRAGRMALVQASFQGIADGLKLSLSVRP